LRRFDQRRSQGVELRTVDWADATRFFLGDKLAQAPLYNGFSQC
jgi:hypothetical protein